MPGGAGGGGTEPLLTLSTIVSPGSADPRGLCPTTVPRGAALSTVRFETFQLACCRTARASFWLRPTTSGTRDAAPPSRNLSSVGGSGRTGWPSRIGFIAPNHVSAGALPPKMLPLRQANGTPAPSQSCCGRLELSNTMTAPASWGVMPTNAADLWNWVVPVLPAIGRSHPTWRAAPAAVPLTASLLRPVIRVLARPGSTAWLHGGSMMATGWPAWSVTESIGLGGHHMPPLASVAPTLASSSTLVGLTPRVNEACFCSLVISAMERPVRTPLSPTYSVVASDFMPRRTAMSTTSGTPVNSSSLTKAVFGDWARASWSDIRSA